jgi:hypothetical protein
MSELQRPQKPRQEICPTHKNHEMKHIFCLILFSIDLKRMKLFLMANKYIKIYPKKLQIVRLESYIKRAP